MKKVFLLPLAALLSGCFLEVKPRQISVEAEAEIEAEPDSFRMNAIIRSRAEDKDGALSELSEKLSRLTEQLPLLEGLSSVTTEPSSLEINPVFDSECEDSRRYSNEETCPVEGYFTEVYVEIKGSPATIAGNAFSLASELGAEEVNFEEYFLADSSAAEREAEEKAFQHAREKAQRLAAAADVTLGKPIRISGDALSGLSLGYFGGESEDTIVVTATRLQPKNILSLEPPPITIEREVSVTFEIE